MEDSDLTAWSWAWNSLSTLDLLHRSDQRVFGGSTGKCKQEDGSPQEDLRVQFSALCYLLCLLVLLLESDCQSATRTVLTQWWPKPTLH